MRLSNGSMKSLLPAAIGGALLILAGWAHLQQFAVLERIERISLDTFFSLRGTMTPDERIVLITIDDQSQQQLGAWPWPRTRIADLLTNIIAEKPRLVVCDMFLPYREEDRAGTERLVQVMNSSHIVMFPFYFSGLGISASSDSLPIGSLIQPSETFVNSSYLLFDQKQKLSTYPPVEGKVLNESATEIVAASLASGHINYFPEEHIGDGVIRWEAQIIHFDGEYYPSLPVQAVSQYLGLTRSEVTVEVATGIHLRDMFVPTSERGWTLINYYGGAETFPTEPATNFLPEAMPKTDLRDKIVFLGVTVTGFQDFLATPLAKRLPGVEKLATSTSNILQNDALRRDNQVAMIEFGALVFLGIVTFALMRRLQPLYGLLFLFGIVVFVWVGAFGLFTSNGWWIKSFGIQLACVATGLGTLAIKRKIGTSTAMSAAGATANMIEYDPSGNVLRIGRFQIVRELGAGAMGKIYEATDSTIQRNVAIKTIRGDIGDMGGEKLRDRFMREAQAAGKLNHPNIVTIYIAEDAGSMSYIAMEYLEGTTLEDYIVRRAPLMLKEITRITAAVASAMDYAHKNGIVHRDIKPANIMLTRDSNVKVMDFGIAYVQASTLTMNGAVLGTPSYMSPEQVRGEVVDGRSDIFSLGVVVYEMATRLRPFLADTLPAISQKILTFNPKRVSDLNPAIPAAFDEVLAKALAKDRAERYQTASELAAALAGLHK